MDEYENLEDVPDVEVTLEKVLDGYPLLYHDRRNLGQTFEQDTVKFQVDVKSEDSPSGYITVQFNYKDKCLVTSKCYKCRKEWTREVYVQMVVMCPTMVGLSMCDECDGGENIIMVGNNKVWSK